MLKAPVAGRFIKLADRFQLLELLEERIIQGALHELARLFDLDDEVSRIGDQTKRLGRRLGERPRHKSQQATGGQQEQTHGIVS